VVTRPLLGEWAAVRDHPRDGVAAALAKSRKHGDKAWQQAQAAFVGFLERLRWYKVLDPACGSGNFLYLALKALKDVEHQVNLVAVALGLERQIDGTGPHNVLGIELNEYAAELARVTVWIGELQWRVQRGYPFKLDPVLEPLDHIECRDAVLDLSVGAEPPSVRAEPVEAPPSVRAELVEALASRLSRSQSPEIKASFFARDHPLMRSSAASASSRVAVSCCHTSFTGRRSCV
jgi:SAM-dependent methyltransferase